MTKRRAILYFWKLVYITAGLTVFALMAMFLMTAREFWNNPNAKFPWARVMIAFFTIEFGLIIRLDLAPDIKRIIERYG